VRLALAQSKDVILVRWSNGNDKHKALPFIISLSLHIIFAALLANGQFTQSSVSVITPIELVGPSQSGGAQGKERYSSRPHHEIHYKSKTDIESKKIAQEKSSLSEKTKIDHNVEQAPAGEASENDINNSVGGNAIGSGQASGTELQAYVSQIVHKIDEVKIYPDDSVFREEQGRVVISIEVQPNGQIGSIQLVESCSFDSLNRAAIETLRRIGKLPPLPQSFKQALKLRIPINYELSKR